MRAPLPPLLALVPLLLSPVVLAAAPAAASAALRPGRPADLEEDVAALLELRDSAPDELVAGLAASGRVEALEAFIEAYGELGTIAGRVRLLEAARAFTRERPGRLVPWLVEAARASDSRAVADAALDTLAACASLGRTALQELAEADLPDALREAALQRHADVASERDTLWYLRLYRPEPEERGRRRRDDDEPKPMPATGRMRRLAFEMALPSLGVPDLAAAVRADGDREVRKRALEELHERDAPPTAELAMEVFEADTEQAENRAFAAEVLWERLGDEIAEEFVDVGTDNVAPLLLRYRLAELLRGTMEPKVERQLVRVLRRGQEFQRMFALRALSTSTEKRVQDELLELLDPDEPNLALLAVDVLVERGDPVALEPLSELVEENDDPTLAGIAADAWAELQPDPDARLERMLAWREHPAVQVRAAAYRRLGEASPDAALEPLASGLAEEEWPCQWAALRSLEELGTPESLGLLVERMQDADGRLLHELSEACWRLTGQPFGERPTTWAKWYAAEVEDLVIVPEEEIARLEAERLARLRSEKTLSEASRRPGTASQFFGVRVVSNRVVFVVDVSGSMERTLQDVYEGERGLDRFRVALTELERCLDVLDPTTRFTIVAFSTYMKVFEPRLVPADEERIESAERFLDDLLPGGGTDIWEALDRALAIDGVDTIYLLSDGEPAGGKLTDPVHIRLAFRRRNVDRSVVVHAIALGAELPLLRWLAEDTGGSYTRFR